jgi:hypothetical protein
MKLIIYVPDDAETLQIISKANNKVKSDATIMIKDKICKCCICKTNFLSPNKTRKHCSERCHADAIRKRKEAQCDQETMMQHAQ